MPTVIRVLTGLFAQYFPCPIFLNLNDQKENWYVKKGAAADLECNDAFLLSFFLSSSNTERSVDDVCESANECFFHEIFQTVRPTNAATGAQIGRWERKEKKHLFERGSFS